MECPKCGLINPDSAVRCDCGYDFALGTEKESYLTPNQKVQILSLREDFTTVDLIISILLPFIGLLLGTYRYIFGKPGAIKMLTISSIAMIISISVIFLLRN